MESGSTFIDPGKVGAFINVIASGVTLDQVRAFQSYLKSEEKPAEKTPEVSTQEKILETLKETQTNTLDPDGNPETKKPVSVKADNLLNLVGGA